MVISKEQIKKQLKAPLWKNPSRLDVNNERLTLDYVDKFKIDLSQKTGDGAFKYQYRLMQYPKRFDILKEILDYFIVDEEDTKYLLALLIWGNQFPNLRSYIYFEGESSLGKSEILKITSKIRDPKCLFIRDSITKSGLVRSEELQEDTKVDTIIIEDMPKDMSLIELFKVLFGKKTKHTMSDPNAQGKYESLDFVLGHFGFATASNLDEIPKALEHRCWMLTPNASPEVNSGVVSWFLRRDRKTPIFKTKDKKMFKILKQLKSAYNISRDPHDKIISVIVPYAEVMEPLFKDLYQHARVRRDVTKFLQAIKISALFHHTLRYKIVRNEDHLLIASPEDLYLILDIGKRFFFETVTNLKKDSEVILDILNNKIRTDVLGRTTKEDYNIKAITKMCGWGENKTKTTYRRIKELIGGGYIEQVSLKRPYTYRIIKTYEKIEIDIDKLKPIIQDTYERELIYWLDSTDDTIKDESEL